MKTRNTLSNTTKTAMMFISFLILIIACLSCGESNPDPITGTWKGTLKFQETELPIVFHISRSETNTLSATMDSPAQNAMGVPMDNVRFMNDTLLIELNAISGAYQGTLQQDGLTFDGTWTQGGTSIDLSIRKEIPIETNEKE